MDANKILESMKGKTFLYQKDRKNHKVLSYKLHGEEFSLVTDLEWFTKHISELSLFAQLFLEVEDEDTEKHTKDIAIANEVNQASNSMMSIKDMLMENIKKVNEDPAFISQAKVVNNQVNTIIKMVKLDLQVKKIIK